MISIIECWLVINTALAAVLALLGIRLKPFQTGWGMTALSVIALFPSLALLSLGGQTWRVVPAQVALIPLLLYFEAFRRAGSGKAPVGGVWSRAWRRVLAGFGLLAALLSTAVVWFFPLQPVSQPSGSYSVGTQIFTFTDSSRLGIYLDGEDQARRFPVQIWYPTDEPYKASQTLGWQTDPEIQAALAVYSKVPSFMMSHLGAIKTNSRPEASPAEGSFPAVLISHGWSGMKALHTNLAEELASHGAIVLVPDHPYGALGSRLSDGTFVPWYEAALAENRNDPRFFPSAAILMETYAGDLRCLLQAVRGRAGTQSNAKLAEVLGRIDTGRIALAGHSTGAGACVKLLQEGEQVAAFYGMDAWLEPLGELVAAGSQVPQLHLGSQQWRDGPNSLALASLLAKSPAALAYTIKNTAHMDFAMLRYGTRGAQLLGWGGALDPVLFEDISIRHAAGWLMALLRSGDATQTLRDLDRNPNVLRRAD